MKLRANPALAPLVTIAVAVVLSEAGNQSADIRVGTEDVVLDAIQLSKAPTKNNLINQNNVYIIYKIMQLD